MFIAKSNWYNSLGLSFQLHYRCWALTRTPLGYPVAVLCHGDQTALNLQDLSLHVFQQIIDGMDVGVGQLITLFLGLGSYRIDQPTSRPTPLACPHHQCELSCIASG